MMSHEEAQTLLIAGGPVPLEVEGHLEACAACRAELAELWALEGDLRRARPAAAPAAVPGRLTYAATRPARRWGQAAAAAALLLGLLGGFAAGRSVPTAPAPVAAGAVQAVTYVAADDTTFALLSATGSLASEEPSDEELADYFESHWGG